MSTTIKDRDLSKEAPHSPHDLIGGYPIMARTVDKCRASISGKLGEFHYDCPLDNMLFGFKGVNGAEFKKAVTASKTYEEVAAWLDKNGAKKSKDEVAAFADQMEAKTVKEISAKKSPEDQKKMQQNVEKLGLDYDTVTLFDWLDADDEASFHSEHAEAK